MVCGSHAKPPATCENDAVCCNGCAAVLADTRAAIDGDIARLEDGTGEDAGDATGTRALEDVD